MQTTIPRAAFTFALEMLRDFRRNQGLLVAGAVAYNTSLSLMPVGLEKELKPQDVADLFAYLRSAGK